MSDDTEKVLRDEARRLASDMLRDPTLVVEYRNVIFDSYEDSQSEEKVRRWMQGAGYSTRHDLLRAELEGAARTNLAAWEGAYVVRVGSALLCLQISASGITLGKARVDGATFTDGVLRFSPTESCAWGGELRFSSVTPKDGSIAGGGVFQRRCGGRLWKKGANRPEGENAAGATMRHTLAASPPDSSNGASAVADGAAARAFRAVVAAKARNLLGADTPAKEFVEKWKGDYKTTLIGQKKDPDTSLMVDTYIAGPDFAVAGKDDVNARFTYIEPMTVDLSSSVAHPSGEKVVFTGGQRTFDLTFAEFTETTRSFSGKIYPEGGKVPDRANVSGIADVPAESPEWGGDIITATVIGGTTLLVTVAGIVALFLSVKYGDSLNAKRDVAQATSEGNAAKLVEAKKRLNDMALEMKAYGPKTITDVPDAQLFSANPDLAEKAATSEVAKLTVRTQQLQIEITHAMAGIDNFTRSEVAAARDKKDAQGVLDGLTKAGAKKEAIDQAQAEVDRHADLEKKFREARQRNERELADARKRHGEVDGQIERFKAFGEHV